jgi:lipopolysaccharide export system permease protein
MPRLVNLYIFKEIAVPFALTLFVLTVTALLSKVIKLVELIVTHGIGIKFAFWFVASVVPSFLIYTIPISFLIGVLVAFTRLSSDSEITAMKASGLSLFTLMRPVASLALVTCLVTMAITLYLFPWGNLNLKRLLFDAARTKLTAGIEEKTFYNQFHGLILYVDRVSTETGEMEGVFISETGPGLADGAGEDEGAVEGGGDGGGGGAGGAGRAVEETNVFFAESAFFVSIAGQFDAVGEEPGGSLYLRLNNGTIHRKSARNDSYHIADFSTYLLGLDIPESTSADFLSRTNRELYPDELVRKVGVVKARGEDPAPYIIDLHKRFALPTSVFVFSLLGLPLGIQRVRTARFTGFSIAMGVVLIYYVLSTALEALGEGGVLNPVAAVWGSDVVIGAAGLYIFYMSAIDRPVGVARWAGRLTSRAFRRITGRHH